MSGRAVARLTLLLILTAGVAAIWFSPLRQHLNREDVRSFVEHLRGLWYGPLVFMGVFAAASLVAIPASVFVLSGGLIWGWKLGGSYAMAGGLLGAVASFLAARFIGDGLLDRFGRAGQVVRRQVDHAGFRSLLVLRFIPGIPFAVLNYGAGVAGVRFSDFVLATIFGMAPSVYVFAFCADSLFNGTMSEGDAVKRLLIVAALMVGLVLLSNLVRRRARPGPEAEG